MGNRDTKNILFHLPFKLDDTRAAASALRPQRMKEAFQEIGYHVHVVSGTVRERRRAIAAIKSQERNGARFAFCYSESSTMPTLLTSSHHMPVAPFLDFGLFGWCKRQNIPIGLFYRDMYWNFPEYIKEVPLHKRVIARLFYILDLLLYRVFVPVLFVPSLEMLDKSPVKIKSDIVRLPPGCTTAEGVESITRKPPMSKTKPLLTLLYIGGINSHVGLENLFSAVRSLDWVRLIICTRQEDWQHEYQRYEKYMAADIEVAHKSGKDLADLYAKSDICLLFASQTEYRRVAMPMKLFEYMSFGKPIIATSDSSAGNYVDAHEVGWAVPYSKEALEMLLIRLERFPAEIREKGEQAFKLSKSNTWVDRATEAEAVLMR